MADKNKNSKGRVLPKANVMITVVMTTNLLFILVMAP
jgi:hypothetical protein